MQARPETIPICASRFAARGDGWSAQRISGTDSQWPWRRQPVAQAPFARKDVVHLLPAGRCFIVSTATTFRTSLCANRPGGAKHLVCVAVFGKPCSVLPYWSDQNIYINGVGSLPNRTAAFGLSGGIARSARCGYVEWLLFGTSVGFALVNIKTLFFAVSATGDGFEQGADGHLSR